MTDVPIDYVAAGIALIDIPRRKKGPITEGWNEAANAITDLDRASELSGNVGIAHACCSPTPTMALDVDDMPRAVSWLPVFILRLRSVKCTKHSSASAHPQNVIDR